MTQFINRAGRAVAVATLAGALLSIIPLHAGQAQQVAAQPAMAAPAKHSVDATETRIKKLHDQLRITASQETLWGTVAQDMRDSAKTMRDSTADRSARLKKMTAIEDLKSYEVIADAHADGLKRLIPAFEALYTSMTPAQQKNADHVFGDRQRHTS